MAEILDRLRARFLVEPEAEVTVECNPESVSRERLAGYRRAGVNRISLGVQSLDDRILPTLDRLHTAREARRAFDAARAAGFDNISADLIYGLPGLDTDTWEATVIKVLEWEPDHLSAYALALDEGSLWHAAGVKGAPGARTSTAEQYWRLARLAREAGYEHYEISNYARPGRRSDHNQIYWRAEEYIGLGPGAAGFLGDVRYVNVKPVERYCALAEDGQRPVGSHEILTPGSGWPSGSSSAFARGMASRAHGSRSGSPSTGTPSGAARRVEGAGPSRRGGRARQPHRSGLPALRRALRRVAVARAFVRRVPRPAV